MKPIINEINNMADLLDEAQVLDYVSEISKYLSIQNVKLNIIGLGAGRMGYALRAFIMRLNHMGFNASMIGDTNVPRVTEDSIIIVNSSSGETPSILNFVKQAVTEKGIIFLTSCSSESSIGNYAHSIINLPVITSTQLMKSPYEQFSMLLYDYIIIKLMESLKLDPIKVSNNHSILE